MLLVKCWVYIELYFRWFGVRKICFKVRSCIRSLVCFVMLIFGMVGVGSVGGNWRDRRLEYS